MSDLGPGSECGEVVLIGASFVDVGPTDSTDPAKPRSERWIPVDEDIHGWSPFMIVHPSCYAKRYGLVRLVELVDESHRLMRSRQH